MDGRVRITVTGIVQGVGFRPTVYNLAVKGGLNGFIFNTSRGVTIEVEGPGAEAFPDALLAALPPLAEVKTIERETLPPAGHIGFEIRLSQAAEGESALVSPDIATCPDCLREMLTPSDRRYLYPFINCTNCGPRYSIVQGVPYDRGLTTMKGFTLCPDCRKEYDDPADRRFHAQPVACPACGPGLAYLDKTTGERAGGDDALEAAIRALARGATVAVKGLGGFQLACDAANDKAVKALRERKRRSRKPFALMARDVEAIRRYCTVSKAEENLLTGRAAPIVLLRKRPEADALLSEDVAPVNNRLGFMLPSTPLHHLLLGHPAFDGPGVPDTLVMTSGNLSEEPIVIDNAEAEDRLHGLADSFLTHDRGIYMRVDDSVARVAAGVPRLIRRARGYAPLPIDLGRDTPEILACGAELKNTLCITKDDSAIVSQHIGDLTNFEAAAFFEETLKNLKRTFSADPHIVAHDMHPDYLSTRFAEKYRPEAGGNVTLIPVQHHHAHIASCMAENGFDGRVIGVAFDGAGYGPDGNSWGGEFLIAGYGGFERFAHLGYMPLPGGDKAVREPWRTALSALSLAYGQDAPAVFRELKPGTDAAAAAFVFKMLAGNTNCPLSSGMGRLFDAVSSIVGLRDEITFEGEAAIALEMAAREAEGSYTYSVLGAGPAVIDASPAVRAVVQDMRDGVSRGEIAARFHNTITDMVLGICASAREKTGLGVVALSGGVFQNTLLFEAVEAGLTKAGFRVLTHSKLPTNDACISLGQAAVAAFGQ